MRAQLERLGWRIKRFLEKDEEPRVVFLGCDFETSTLEGGSTRIIAVTDSNIVVLRSGLLRRSTPYGVVERRALAELANPFFAWPGRTLYGEEYAEVIPRLQVHRRYRKEVVAAYGLACSFGDG